jgi:hypothetical protein
LNTEQAEAILQENQLLARRSEPQNKPNHGRSSVVIAVIRRVGI